MLQVSVIGQIIRCIQISIHNKNHPWIYSVCLCVKVTEVIKGVATYVRIPLCELSRYKNEGSATLSACLL